MNCLKLRYSDIILLLSMGTLQSHEKGGVQFQIHGNE